MSPEREAALGAQAAQQVEAQIGLVDDPELEAYVDALGQRLARHSPRRDVAYRFFVADMEEPNAFALPGGYIYISRGLLAIANSEAELANVIGHEIGHVAARHSAQRETSAIGVGLLTVLGTVLAGAAGGEGAAQTVAQVGQVAGAGLIASYGRDQERQADEVGQKLAAASGFDPQGMAQFLGTLERETELRLGAPRRPSFLDSHPVTGERVRDTAARAGTLEVVPVAPIAGSRAEFLARVDGILVGPDPAEGVFQESRFLHADMDFVLDFPTGWRTNNGKSAVGAQAPSEDAAVIVQLQGGTGDPRAAAQTFAQQNRLTVQDGRRETIGGFEAFRGVAQASGAQGPIAVDLTWIAHPRAMFRIAGMSTPRRFEDHAASFLRTAKSFRGLTRSERTSIRERRLRVVRARSGESLTSLSRRTDNVWSVDETAVANGVSREIRLRSGDLVKIAVEVPYRGG